MIDLQQSENRRSQKSQLVKIGLLQFLLLMYHDEHIIYRTYIMANVAFSGSNENDHIQRKTGLESVLMEQTVISCKNRELRFSPVRIF